MAVYITPKKALLRFALSLSAAFLALLGVNRLLAGPRLGPHYDYLLEKTASSLPSRELLLIDAGSGTPILDPSTAASVLITLAELDAGELILQIPVLGIAAGSGEADLRNRFNEEFSLLDRNIRNLFEAIRMGFVAPQEADRYVEDLIKLAERGRERLTAALLYQDGADMERFHRAAALFGRCVIPGDLRFTPIREDEGEDAAAGEGRYSLSRPDPDGRLRRIVPLREAGGERTEHGAYAALRLWGRRKLRGEYAESGPVLVIQEGEESRVIPLDRGGGILFRMPPREQFRRIALEDLTGYERADKELRRLLDDAEYLFRDLAPEEAPAALYDYALSLRENVSGENPPGDSRERWKDARSRYLQALEDFFSAENAGAEKLRETYAAFAAQRKSLERDLASSFCVLGSPGTDINPSDAEASLILANSILTGAVITPGTDRHIIFWSLLAALLILLPLCKRGPFVTLTAGLFLILLEGGAFSYSVILNAYWIDPLIPLSASAAGLSASWICALGMKGQASGRFRRAYGPCISREHLRALIRRGRPLPSESRRARAALIAIRNPPLSRTGDPLRIAEESAEFRSAAFGLFAKAGGVLAGCGGDTVLIAFGSPLERSALEKLGLSPKNTETDFVLKAADLIADCLRSGAGSWRFGVDAGECVFRCSPAGGYEAFGLPAARARTLASLCSRYQADVLISASAAEKIEQRPMRKLDVLVNQDGEIREMFYQLLIR
jgi:class 3 adenylate cyclase